MFEQGSESSATNSASSSTSANPTSKSTDEADTANSDGGTSQGVKIGVGVGVGVGVGGALIVLALAFRFLKRRKQQQAQGLPQADGNAMSPGVAGYFNTIPPAEQKYQPVEAPAHNEPAELASDAQFERQELDASRK